MQMFRFTLRSVLPRFTLCAMRMPSNFMNTIKIDLVQTLSRIQLKNNMDDTIDTVSIKRMWLLVIEGDGGRQPCIGRNFVSMLLRGGLLLMKCERAVPLSHVPVN